MSETRQQILILHLSRSELDSETIAWALYDGAKSEKELQMQTGDSDVPPYKSVLAAMRDGWNVIQLPTLPYYHPGQEHTTGHLLYEYVLERKVPVHG
jgi:hypothetical protein